MKESKVAGILRTLSKDEMKSFERLIISPFFGSRRDVSGYLRVLKGYYPEFNVKKEVFFTKLFPGADYNERKLKNLGAQLIQLAEQFLVHNAIRIDKTEFNKQLAAQYQNRKNPRGFLNTLRALENHFESTKFSSVECFSGEEELNWMEMSYYLDKNEFEKAIKLRAKHTEHFTASFLIRFLRRLRDKNSFAAYNVPFEGMLIEVVSENINFDKIISGLEEKNYPLLWLIKIYYYVYLTSFDSGDISLFDKLRKLFYENINKFSRLEKYFLFNDLIDYCSRKENAGELTYRQKEFDTYTEMFMHDAYSTSEEEYLSLVLYRNVMLLTLSLKEYDWLNRFIEEYTNKLKPEYRENMMNLGRANLYFEKGDFEGALKYVSKVQYDFFLYKTDIKNLMLKIYYELGLFDAAFSLIDAYRHFLAETNEIEEGFKKQYANFLNIYNKLIKAKSDKNPKEADYILHQINKTPVLSSRIWLKKKAEELAVRSGR